MTMLLLHLNNSVVCFYYSLHFLRCLQRSQAQQQNFYTRDKLKLFAEKNAQQRLVNIASLSKRFQS